MVRIITLKETSPHKGMFYFFRKNGTNKFSRRCYGFRVVIALHNLCELVIRIMRVDSMRIVLLEYYESVPIWLEV